MAITPATTVLSSNGRTAKLYPRILARQVNLILILQIVILFRCDADLELVSEYIIALVKNNHTQASFEEQLQAFLGDYTHDFVSLLMERLATMEKEASEGDDEIQVDFEEDDAEEADEERGRSVLTAQTRQLREYSPERPETNESTGSSTTPKRPCFAFQKYGKCRFGDACHFAHVARPAPRTCRILIENLPADLQVPEVLVQRVKSAGSVVAIHVEPEKASATVQFGSADEAEAAVSSSLFSEPVKVSLLQRERKPKPERQIREKSNLPALLELQKKQQALLARCIADQKKILEEIEAGTLGEAEQTERLATLTKLQGTCASVQQMLKSTTQMILEEKEKNPSTLLTKPKYPRAPLPQTRLPKMAPASRSLDLRPTELRLAALEEPLQKDIHALQRLFAPFGSILSLKFADGGSAAVIKYQRHEDAKKALESCKEKYQIDWEQPQQQ